MRKALCLFVLPVLVLVSSACGALEEAPPAAEAEFLSPKSSQEQTTLPTEYLDEILSTINANEHLSGHGDVSELVLLIVKQLDSGSSNAYLVVGSYDVDDEERITAGVVQTEPDPKYLKYDQLVGGEPLRGESPVRVVVDTKDTGGPDNITLHRLLVGWVQNQEVDTVALQFSDGSRRSFSASLYPVFAAVLQQERFEAGPYKFEEELRVEEVTASDAEGNTIR